MIFIGLGSNLGDRKKFLRRAFDELSLILKKIKISSIYESQALLLEGSPISWNLPFYNMVLAGETDLQPFEFLDRLKHIEKKLGRREVEKWSPREIDLDILIWNDLTINEKSLQVPHPEMKNRPFVLQPLLEIKAELRGLPMSAGELLQASAKGSGVVRRLDDSVLMPVLMGVLNITPDSFSDGGAFLEKAKAMSHAEKLIRDGAKIIDLGAESTRPGAVELSAAEEWARLGEVLQMVVPIAVEAGVKISVDTRHPETARQALDAGAHIINDVTGFDNPDMVTAVIDSDCDLIFMHHLGVPPKKDAILPLSRNPASQVIEWAEIKIAHFRKAGVSPERLIFDPGIGFGKNAAQNMTLLREAQRFLSLGVRVLIGHSRKSFLNQVTEKAFAHRDTETLTLSLELARQHVHYLRVHDVESHVRAFRTRHFFEHRL